MNANRGCRVTAWREGSETGPKLNLSMSKQFCVRDAMGESVFLGTVPNVQIFLFTSTPPTAGESLNHTAPAGWGHFPQKILCTMGVLSTSINLGDESLEWSSSSPSSPKFNTAIACGTLCCSGCVLCHTRSKISCTYKALDLRTLPAALVISTCR